MNPNYSININFVNQSHIVYFERYQIERENQKIQYYCMFDKLQNSRYMKNSLTI